MNNREPGDLRRHRAHYDVIVINYGIPGNTDIFSVMPHVTLPTITSFAPGSVEWEFRQVIFKLISVIIGWGISCEMTPKRMSPGLTDDKSALVQVMA